MEKSVSRRIQQHKETAFVSVLKMIGNLLLWPLRNPKTGLLTVAVLVLFIIIIRDLWPVRLIVFDIQAPKSLEEKGYDSKVITDKLISNIKLGGSQGCKLFPNSDVCYISIEPLIMSLRNDADNLTVYSTSYNSILCFIARVLILPIPKVKGNIVETKPNTYLFTSSVKDNVFTVPFTANDIEKSIQSMALKICLKVFPYELALSYFDMQRHEECLSSLDEFIPESSKETARKLLLQGAANVALIKYEEAMKNFLMAYEIKNEPLIMHNVASVKLEQCLYSEAIQLENALIASGNGAAYGYTIMGNAYSKLLDTKNAELHFQKALEIDPKFAPAYFQWGIMLDLRNNDLRGAIEKYKLCLQADPNFYEAAGNLAYAHGKLGEVTEAQKLSEKAFSIIKTKRLNIDYEIKGNSLVIGETSATRERRAKAKASVCR